MKNKANIITSMYSLPVVQGPILVTENSHPFCAMDYCREPLDLKKYGYLEEEFFVSGKAYVYDVDDSGGLQYDEEALPYKTRILVRRPANEKKFSGRVYVDIMNATQGYDIEDLWHRNYLWCMKNGHGYVGITSKPVNVQSLKNFDYERYHSLCFSSKEIVPMPTVSCSATLPGTEEGLIWDIISQIGYYLRGGNICFPESKVEYLYLTGQSQSGAYLNTYISYFDQFMNNEKGRIYDGYMNIVGALVQRSLRQEPTIGPLRLKVRNMNPVSAPYICVSSEADLYLFNMFLEENLFEIQIENTNSEGEKCRYYEIAGAPHTDIVCPILTAVSEIEKMGGKIPNLDQKLLDNINDIPTEFYLCGLLDKLHEWVEKGIAPQVVDMMERNGNDIRRDKYGNACGGFRTPFLDVPIASYVASNSEDPEGICGKMTLFTKEMFFDRYQSKEDYLQQFTEYTHRQEREGWVDTEAAQTMVHMAEIMVEKVMK